MERHQESGYLGGDQSQGRGKRRRRRKHHADAELLLETHPKESQAPASPWGAPGIIGARTRDPPTCSHLPATAAKERRAASSSTSTRLGHPATLDRAPACPGRASPAPADWRRHCGSDARRPGPGAQAAVMRASSGRAREDFAASQPRPWPFSKGTSVYFLQAREDQLSFGY